MWLKFFPSCITVQKTEGSLPLDGEVSWWTISEISSKCWYAIAQIILTLWLSYALQSICFCHELMINHDVMFTVVHTMEELKLTGNHLKGSRPLLTFSANFDEQPHWKLVKEMITQVCNWFHILCLTYIHMAKHFFNKLMNCTDLSNYPDLLVLFSLWYVNSLVFK